MEGGLCSLGMVFFCFCFLRDDTFLLLFLIFKNIYLAMPGQVALVVKSLPANAGDVRDVGSIPGLRRSPGGGHGNPLRVLGWRISWTEEPGGLHSWVAKSQIPLQ